jgi:hypothetical protein
MTVAQWLSAARADAERRGLPDLVPVLESLASALAVLRAQDAGCDGPPEATAPSDKSEPSGRA